MSIVFADSEGEAVQARVGWLGSKRSGAMEMRAETDMSETTATLRAADPWPPLHQHNVAAAIPASQPATATDLPCSRLSLRVLTAVHWSKAVR